MGRKSRDQEVESWRWSRDVPPPGAGKMVGDEHSTSERTLSLREYKALLKTLGPRPPQDQEDGESIFVEGRVLYVGHVPLARVGLRC